MTVELKRRRLVLLYGVVCAFTESFADDLVRKGYATALSDEEAVERLARRRERKEPFDAEAAVGLLLGRLDEERWDD